MPSLSLWKAIQQVVALLTIHPYLLELVKLIQTIMGSVILCDGYTPPVWLGTCDFLQNMISESF